MTGVLLEFSMGRVLFNPIGPGRFFDACVPGGVLFDPPLKMDFLRKKCAILCPGIKFDKILAIF